MLNQNVTPILPTLVGGVLAIVGGFLATYFSQKLASKTENRKMFASKIEEIYILSDQINESLLVQMYHEYHDLKVNLKGNNSELLSPLDTIQKIKRICERTEMLIRLYAPSLIDDFETYKNFVEEFQITISKFNRMDEKEKSKQMSELLDLLIKYKREFQSSIENLVKRLGYNG